MSFRKYKIKIGNTAFRKSEIAHIINSFRKDIKLGFHNIDFSKRQKGSLIVQVAATGRVGRNCASEAISEAQPPLSPTKTEIIASTSLKKPLRTNAKRVVVHFSYFANKLFLSADSSCITNKVWINRSL